jgi:hypothetical protein
MESNQNILKSFLLQDELNPAIWILSEKGDETIKPEIREQLLEIAYQFIEFLDVPLFVSDIILTGSLTNYNWSKYSDFDLHLLVDYKQFPKGTKELYEKLFNLKKMLFNTRFNIKIKNYDVELYAQDEDEPRHKSAGVYSILFDEWLNKPKKENVEINKEEITQKSNMWMKTIDDVIENASDEDIDDAKKMVRKYKAKIKKFRQCGLDRGGEYSTENLVFKVLRRNGYIEKLFDFENELLNKRLSMENKIND